MQLLGGICQRLMASTVYQLCTYMKINKRVLSITDPNVVMSVKVKVLYTDLMYIVSHKFKMIVVEPLHVSTQGYLKNERHQLDLVYRGTLKKCIHEGFSLELYRQATI